VRVAKVGYRYMENKSTECWVLSADTRTAARERAGLFVMAACALHVNQPLRVSRAPRPERDSLASTIRTSCLRPRVTHNKPRANEHVPRQYLISFTIPSQLGALLSVVFLSCEEGLGPSGVLSNKCRDRVVVAKVGKTAARDSRSPRRGSRRSAE